MNEQIDELLEAREEVYGDSWFMAGEAMGFLRKPLMNLLSTAPWMAHNWVLMLSKLIRILYSPYHRDNWADIVGYATLVLNSMDENPNHIVMKMHGLEGGDAHLPDQ